MKGSSRLDNTHFNASLLTVYNYLHIFYTKEYRTNPLPLLFKYHNNLFGQFCLGEWKKW